MQVVLASLIVIVLVFFLALLVYGLNFMVGLFIENPMIQTGFLPAELPDAVVEHETERVKFETRDGITLSGLFLRGTRRADTTIGVVVFAPEYGGTAESWRKYTQFLIGRGYVVFAFDFRGTGDSEVPDDYRALRWCSEDEVEDVLAAMRCAREHTGFKDVMAMGVSRGAVATLAAIARDKNVAAAVVDSAPSTREIILQYSHRWAEIWVPRWGLNLVPGWMYPIFATLVLRLSEWRLSKALPLTEHLPAPASGCTTLFIYGGRDRHVPPEVAAATYRRFRGDKLLLQVPKARHNQNIVIDPEGYARAILELFDAAIQDQTESTSVQAHLEPVVAS